MKKFQKLSLQNQAVYVYLLSLGVSIIVSPLFGKIYIKIFKPIFMGDLFIAFPTDERALCGGTILAYFLFLPFFTFLCLKQKQWKAWVIGVAFPFSIFLVGGVKDIFWAIIFSAIGWVLAQGILFIKKSYRK